MAHYCLTLISLSTVFILRMSSWDIWVLEKHTRLGYNNLLHHSGLHSHFTKACRYLNVLLIITLIYLTANSNFSGFLFYLLLSTHIYQCTGFTLREVIWLWQVSSLAGECSQLKVAVMNSGRCHWLMRQNFSTSLHLHLCPWSLQIKFISVAKENSFFPTVG